MNSETEVGPRICNTGATNTKEGGLIACIDWFSCTFHTIHKFEDVCALLGMKVHDFKLLERGFNGYRKSVACKNITILFDPPENTVNMGCHLNISGEGCREYEQQFSENKNWSTFIALCLNFDVKFTRLDIAIDDFQGHLSLKTIMNKVKKGHVTSRFISARNFQEHLLKDGSTQGQTIYFGKGDIMFRFYDKYKERINKGYSIKEEIKVWQRYEIQLRSFKATEACKVLAYESYETGQLARGLFLNYLNFRKPSKTDTNKSRWATCKWWLDFLGECSKISLSQVPPEVSIQRTKHWLDNQVSASLAMIHEAFGSDPMVMKYLLTLGKNKMDLQKLEMIEDFKNDDMAKKLLKRKCTNIFHRIPTSNKKQKN